MHRNLLRTSVFRGIMVIVVIVIIVVMVVIAGLRTLMRVAIIISRIRRYVITNGRPGSRHTAHRRLFRAEIRGDCLRFLGGPMQIDGAQRGE